MNLKPYCHILSVILLLLSISSRAQTDKEFWFAAPEVSLGLKGVPVNSTLDSDRPIVIRITAYSQPTTVTISQPAGVGSGYMPPQVINIPAGGTQSVDLTQWIDSIENKPANTVLNYGIKISATEPISAYYEVVSATCQCNPEIWVLKGRNALGTDFWIPSQNLIDNGYHPGTIAAIYEINPKPYSSFDIVATENNTVVTITPAQAVVGHAAGTAFTVTLNAGQTYSSTATGYLAAAHLNGSRVTSTKPVAVTYKDDLARDATGTFYAGGCGDLGGDQIVPTRLLGQEYIAMTGQLNGIGDQLFVMATRNNTQIFRDGGAVPVATINAGTTYRMSVAATPGQPSTYVRTSEPVSVLQMSGFGCEVGQTILPAVKCTGSAAVSFVRSTAQQLIINLLVGAGGQGNFLINGTPLTTTFSAVPGTANQWFAAQVSLPVATYPQNSVINVSNTTTLFHLGMRDGTDGTGTRFGYFSNYAVVEAEATAASNEVCQGDSIRLFANGVLGGRYTWSGPGGFSSNLQNPVIPNAGQAQSGLYILVVDLADCGSDTDAIQVNVHDLPKVNLGQDISICADSVVLEPLIKTPGNAYLWIGGSANDSLVIRNSGAFWVRVTDTAGCAGVDSINVVIHTALEVDLGNDTVLCHTDLPFLLSSVQDPGTQYIWSNGLTGPTLQVTQGGLYWLEVSRDNCRGADTVLVTAIQAPDIYAGNDTIICEAWPVRLGLEVYRATYQWSTGETTPYIFAGETGSYVIAVNLDGCIVRDTVSVTAMPSPDIRIGPDRDICPDQMLTLDAAYGTNTTYLWSTGESTASVQISSAGLYWVTVTTEYHCIGKDSVVISFYPKPVVTLGPDTTVCDEQPLRLIPGQINADSLTWSDGSVGDQLYITNGGTYTVTGLNKCGTDADTILVRQIFCDIWLPNVFTPNGDGINDVFRILGNTGRLEGLSFSIFNRWGERCFYTTDKYIGWDGKHNGADAMLGTYVYLLQYSIGGVPYLQKGNFHLIR